MEINEFLGQIKANGNSKDRDDLSKVHREFKDILVKLSSKDRGSFSLNVLCLLCRNLDKVPSWKEAVDTKDLVMLSIDCIRETRGLTKADQVKTLACVYHVHRHVVRQNSQVPPELVLKLSFMPFETDSKNLLKEYCKTYWNILADRLTYIEKLKGRSVHKLLPKLTEDIINTIEIYDTVQFCANVLVFLLKKLHSIYSESNSEQLNVLYGEIFKKLSTKNDTTLKKLNEEATLDLYIKISDCLYVVAENASKTHFKRSSLSIAVRGAISLLGHQSDMFHCLQTFYLNSFCDLFENKTTYADAVFKNLTISCEMTEKLGYRKTMLATYANLNQFLRLYVEYSVTNAIKENFSEEIQENCLNFMLKVLNMLKYSQQLLKCDNCNVKSALHDALRLSFLLKHFITNSLQYNININSLIVLYNKLIFAQYNIMDELKQLKCVNSKKFHQKLQTDTHNTAILLNRHQKYEFSITLFEIYIRNELVNYSNELIKQKNELVCGNKNEIEYKNVSRAFYNKSICELDYKKYDMALFDAYLSLIFSEDLNSDKHMSLVMDIKAKSLKDDTNDGDGDDEQNDLQLLSVADACRIVLEKGFYVNIDTFLKNVKLSFVLKHEFLMYSKLWPSIMPIAGVWKSLHQMLEGNHETWMIVEDKETILWNLLEVMCLTPSAVRSINNDHFKNITNKILDYIDTIPDPVSIDIRVVQTTLLFLKCEYDIAAASAKYGWKITEPSLDPDQLQLRRTLQQEHEATLSALRAVELFTEIVTNIHTVTRPLYLRPLLDLSEVFVQQLLNFSRIAHGLQLAHLCCQVAQHIGLHESYIRNVGTLAYNVPCVEVVQDMISTASDVWEQTLVSRHSVETALAFLSDVAIYYYKCGNTAVFAKLVALAQGNILKAYETYPDINLDVAVGKLLEAQAMSREGLSVLTQVNGLQRHFLSINNNGVPWSSRRLRSCTCRNYISSCTAECVRVSAGVRLLRRARASLGAAHTALPAYTLARTHAHTLNTHNLQQTQVTIDNRLKYILGLNTEPQSSIKESKIELFAPKQDLEVMLESQHLKSLSPTRKYVQIPGFKLAEFLQHSNCDCFACGNIYCSIMFYIIGGVEASMYFRANETEIAKNYYEGVINSFKYFQAKLKQVLDKYIEMDFKEYIINCVKNSFEEEFRRVRLDILIEATYFELKNHNFDAADDYLVTVHEILQEMRNSDGYLTNEVMNLMIASARVRNVIKKQETDLETDFENLRLSPKGEVPKTPISKPILQEVSAKKPSLRHEELPKKRKVIKLNLDEGSSDERDAEKPKQKPVFKIPVPVTSRAVPESITPRVTRKPEITVSDMSRTPKTGAEDTFSMFSTPLSTPEQFFTPLNTIKTYSKGSLRKGIVKNLEEAFSTPVGKEAPRDKLEVPTRSGRKVERGKRATSPGKVSEQTRPRRLRQPKLNE